MDAAEIGGERAYEREVLSPDQLAASYTTTRDTT